MSVLADRASIFRPSPDAKAEKLTPRGLEVSLNHNLHVIVNHINGTNQNWPQRCDSGSIIVYTIYEMQEIIS